MKVGNIKILVNFFFILKGIIEGGMYFGFCKLFSILFFILVIVVIL